MIPSWIDPRQMKIYDSLNAISGENKAMVKQMIMSMPISNRHGQKGNVTEEFADQLASLVMATHLEVSKSIMEEFVIYCQCGINPELSPSFREKILVHVVAVHSHTLMEKASDFSLRSSSAKHKKRDNQDAKDPGYAFGGGE